ncbi:daptide-type RiPP biosynthesis dehydogenase [Frankia sp. R82]|uniref:daptide-type RiPP biosynthesis dehydogenase n=1 Tax=Frankia sp. R82 TaxID=2950553 RepID=UPI002042D8EF|nr:daptide-type RiPP biosynthesis dehydogenase [Frankia sp. R82]MCM3883389.1 iron-containing alcohol dehydrogenase [Frankia sp. R82]
MAYGIGGLSQWLPAHGGRSLTLLADAAVADTEVVARVQECAVWAGRSVERVVLTGPGSLEKVAELAGRLHGSELVVAVGGGTLLDQAKLAVLLASDPAVRDRLSVRHRSGLILLSAESVPRIPLVTVPTTVGTGSECSGAICLGTDQGKRLVLGNGLQPAVAVLDPVATRTLPVELLTEGILEVLFRTAGMYVGDHQELPTEDAFVLTLVERLVQLATELEDVRAGCATPGDRLRLEIAKLSGLSHSQWLNLDRDPCACKGWYLANELSTGLGLRKMTAAAALLPPLWERIAKADPRWGSAERLHRLWQVVASARKAPLPTGPADGIAALMDAWQVERGIDATPERIEEIAQATTRAWGDGLPTLGALTLSDVRQVMSAAIHTPAAAPGSPRPGATAGHRLPLASADGCTRNRNEERRLGHADRQDRGAGTGSSGDGVARADDGGARGAGRTVRLERPGELC